jgi:hypothetical protein
MCILQDLMMVPTHGIESPSCVFIREDAVAWIEAAALQWCLTIGVNLEAGARLPASTILST